MTRVRVMACHCREMTLILKTTTLHPSRKSFAFGEGSNSCARCSQHTVLQGTTLALSFFEGALAASPNTVHYCIRHRKQNRALGFENTPLLLECLALGVNGYSAVLFRIMLYAKCVPYAKCGTELLSSRVAICKPGGIQQQW